MPALKEKERRPKYDVALSFAGEDREFVEETARALRDRRIKVFYDRYEEADLWGKDLYSHLRDVYTNQAEFTIIFISQHYARKLWTSHERESAQARAFEEHREYILPARFDAAEIPGILTTTGYVDLREKTPQQLAELIEQKVASLGSTERKSHRLVESKDDEAREESVLLEISTAGGSFLVAVETAAYRSLQTFLDDVFQHYLAEYVPPYSYGSQWILVGEPFMTRIVAPVEWVLQHHKSITEIAPDWSLNRCLEDDGIVPGARWEVRALESGTGLVEGFNLGRYYGLLTNSAELAELATSHAKSVALLAGHQQFRHVDIADPKEFLFQYVFRDWLTISPGKILIDEGKAIPKETQRLFRH